MKKKLFFFTFFYSLFIFSQEENKKDSVFINSNFLDEIVVSASKFKEKKSDIAQQVLSITKKNIENSNSQTSADLIQNTGNITVQKSQAGGGSPIMRGFEASKILLVIDGIRMNNAIYRSGHLQNIVTIDPSMLENVEIIFGPNSVIYGSDALGGVIHFRTKNPVFAGENKPIFNANLITRFASANQEKTSNINFNFGLKKWGFLSSATFSQFGDVLQGSNRNHDYTNFGKRFYYSQTINGKDQQIKNQNPELQKETDYYQYDFLQKISYKSSELIRHTLNFQFSNSSNINRYDRLTDVNNKGNLRFSEWFYGPQKRLLTAYHLDLLNKNSFFDQSKIILSYQNIEESRNNRNFGNSFLNKRIENLNVFTLNADFEKQFKNHEFRYGIESTYNDVNSEAFQENIFNQERKSLSTRYPDGGSSMFTNSLYVFHTWEITQKYIFAQGLRYNISNLQAKFNDKTFFPFLDDKINQNNQALSGTISFVAKPNSSWKLSSILSTGYRVPNIDDLAKVFDSKKGTVIIPNPNLKPEYTYNAEIGISKIISNKIKIETNVFYTLYKNALHQVQTTLNGESLIEYEGEMSQIYTINNANEGFLYGYSASLNAYLTKKLNLNTSLNYTYGRIIEDKIETPLSHIAPLFGKTSLIYTSKKIETEIYALYSAAKKLKDYSTDGEDNLQYATPEGIPSWKTFNFKFIWSLNPKMKFQFAIENILDENYRVFASGIHSPGRNFIVGFRYFY